MKIEKIAKDKQLQLDRQYYEKYSGVFDAVIEYVRHQPALLYGGTAINEYMPQALKIYDEYVLPDIDVFSASPEKLASGVIEYLTKKGYSASTYYDRALHRGTFTVYSMGLKVMDISLISPLNMRRLQRHGIRGPLGIKCVSPLFLRFTLHLMLASANAATRWEKVHARVATFYKVFPPKTKLQTPVVNTVVDEEIHYYTEKTPNTLLLGTPLVNLMIGRNVNEYRGVPFNIIMVQGSAQLYANNMLLALADLKLRASELYRPNNVINQPAHVVVTHGGRQVAVIFEEPSEFCFNYNEYQGVRVGTIHTVLTVYLSMMLCTEYHFIKLMPALENVTDALSRALFSNKRGKIMKQLSLTCVGTEVGLATLRRNRFRNNK